MIKNIFVKELWIEYNISVREKSENSRVDVFFFDRNFQFYYKIEIMKLVKILLEIFFIVLGCGIRNLY